MKLTASQQAAVDHRGASLLVSASAGSGKTEVLARRCVGLVADPRRPCDVTRLLVVTFTRAAAAELRVRVGRELRAAAQQTTEQGLRHHLARQELLVETADIGTIDAWCGRLVRAHFAEVGVDVDYTVLGEEDAAVLRRQVLDRLMAELHAGGTPAGEAARAWMARAPAPGDSFLRHLIEGLNRFREHLVNPQAWLVAQRAAARLNAGEMLAAALAAECEFQQAQLGALSGQGGEIADVLAPYAGALADWCARLADAGALREVTQEISEFALKKQRGQSEPAAVAEVRERWLKKRLQKWWGADEVAGLLDNAGAAAVYATTLLDLEERYHALLAEEKRRRAAYEFADVLALALDVLGTPGAGQRRAPTAAARRLQAHYEHILVDEYQDTSPVQVELLRLVARAEPGRTNRFLVGDVKQSIYGFRNAEPRLFSALTDAFASGRAEGRVQYLADNFRSHGGVLGPLNELFALLFDPALGGTAFGPDERLKAARAEIANPTLDGAPRVSIQIIAEEDRRVAAAEDGDIVQVERIEREAQLAADEIRRLLDAGVQVPQRRPDGEVELRPMRPADVAILLRSAAGHAPLVARVLRDNGVACVAAGKETLLDALEVRDVTNVLALLANRRQDVPLAAYLRGPLVGLTDDELLALRATAGARGGDFHDALERYLTVAPDTRLADKLRRALAQLETWGRLACEEELPVLLRRIVQDGELLLFARGLRGGAQRETLLRALLGRARDFAATQRDAAEFAAYLEDLAGAEVDPAAQAPRDEDAVRIMTIHAAKGLEFPVVFLLGTGGRFNEQSQRDPLLCDEAHGLGIKFNDYPARTTIVSPVHHVARLARRQRELAEELRLLYVATTRARERLVIIGHAGPDAWRERSEQYGGRRAAPPLLARLSVTGCLEWVLMAVAAGGLHAPGPDGRSAVSLSEHAAGDIEVAAPDAVPAAAPALPPRADDRAWLDRARELLGRPPERALSELPAVLSVSAAKALARRGREEDTAREIAAHPERLRLPVFVETGGAPDGRVLGTACHRFLEFADLARLGNESQVQGEIGRLMEAGHLSPDDAALLSVADLAWLGTSELGRLLAARPADVRREVPFVYALPVAGTSERAVVRGVIDCLVVTPTGLLLADYKTDQPRDEADFAERVADYGVQLRVYAQAAGALFDRPVTRAVLAFLRVRRLVEVALPANPLTLQRLVGGAEAPAKP